jgi:hypothetical protein
MLIAFTLSWEPARREAHLEARVLLGGTAFVVAALLTDMFGLGGGG